MKTTRLGFYSTTENVRSQFASAAENFVQSWFVKDNICGSVESLTAHVSNKLDPDNLLFFGTEATGEVLLSELNQLAEVCSPDSEVFVFSPERDVFIYREILGMGVTGCEGLPVESDFIVKSVSSFLNTEESGKLILGASVLAGVGFSTTFLNLASRCAYRIGPKLNVSLIDGDSSAGITNLFISQNPKTFVQFDDSSSSDFFRGSVECDGAKHSNFRIFPTPARLLDTRKMSNVFLEEGLAEVNRKSDYTLVDFGLFNDLWNCQAIEYCDHIFLATRPTLNGVRVLREVIQNVIDSRGPIEKIVCLMVGRGRGGKNEISLKKLKEILPNIEIFDVPDMPSYVFLNESAGSIRFQSKKPKNKYEKSIDLICSKLIG
jgi:pilus assembly protein CpaE